MLQNKISTNFEQTLRRKIPPHALKMIRSIAREVQRSAHKAHGPIDQLELAHAKMHMQVYQRFGAASNEFMHHAHQALDDLVALEPGARLPATFELPTHA